MLRYARVILGMKVKLCANEICQILHENRGGSKVCVGFILEEEKNSLMLLKFGRLELLRLECKYEKEQERMH